ncbi:2-succinyl-5-enolpyruvyl-6-hydroxy-3-cyclohexene-1-carboxylic-acid synthase [Nocardioides gilvus]|uniref:2-succinyl-5-enolpyruvyl-6-hydroxy-3- cyclohexene-1-carboxylic-acid synthase n=1 Tax=Nocardioides gilvus TaxID=1735589 RepID=UPI000D744F83|nr:2-succinyl-5-enolpyruvyl-6-hydroxy-3-cyclohexene-1-carboxylic-acid synthase [Nocardioides gilvus]
MNDSTHLARQVVQALLDEGVRDAVLSPGSRNAPLSFALLDAERAGLLRLHTRIDERSGAFLALGLARTSSRPVVVSCTSGTAVANLAPAALEAHHSGVPLIAVTADRPARLRGTSANQTTDQVGLLPRSLGGDIASGQDAASVVAALLATGGPVHLNVQFDDPLMPEDRWEPRPPAEAYVAPGAAEQSLTGSAPLPQGPRTVVVAGDSAGPAARVLAEQGGWPLLAEPSSGARSGAHAVGPYRLLLDGHLGRRIERVVLLGHPTLTRPVTQLLSRDDVEVVDIDPLGRWARRPFPVARTLQVAHAEPPSGPAEVSAGAEWLAQWQDAGRALTGHVAELLGSVPELTAQEVAGAVARAVDGDGLLFVGPSSPVRDLDLMMTPRATPGLPLVLANRGLAGIDGVVSSAIGAALGRTHAGLSDTRAIALMGDVTFLHDANGLVIGPAETTPDLTVVVVNDDGGSIFSLLEQGADDHVHAFERLFGTPHGVDIASLCAATRTPHWRVESLAELEHALAQPAGGLEVIEVKVRRDTRREMDERIRDLRP